MTLASILKNEKDRLRPLAEDILQVKKSVAIAILVLKRELARRRLKATINEGGSYARGTMVRKEAYEVDIFLRYEHDDGNLSELTEPLVATLSKQFKARYERVHGSRDYFRVYVPGLILEIIPVLKIAKPSQEKNVTDLSYFHVAYVQKKARKLEDDIRLAKTFCKAQHVYGAESYVNGFSGYALECLIIHYKGFMNFLKALSKVKEQIIIDPARHYKNANLVRISLNESKSRSPIILVDPTYKERNALAALSYEKFFTFQQAAQAFLKRPSESFFTEKAFNVSSFKKEAYKKKAEFIEIEITTDRQAGDIAGTKLKKFYSFLKGQVDLNFIRVKEHFTYTEGKNARIYFVLKSRKEIVRKGPTLDMLEYATEFKKMHKKTFSKGGRLYATIPITFSARTFFNDFAKKPILKEMAVTDFRVLSS